MWPPRYIFLSWTEAGGGGGGGGSKSVSGLQSYEVNVPPFRCIY